FDQADFSNFATSATTRERFFNVVLHEMAHVMGFGTLWDNNGIYVNNSGEFLGAEATAAWQQEFGQNGTPDVELGGGPGTANGHWNEVDFGAANTGITVTDPNSPNFNRDLRNELMTGWLNSNPFISDMTVASFADIGFVRQVAAIPEPSSVLLMTVGAVGALGWRRRRGA
ncbi:MAG: PEP-CTERM sorting domain-containing protein, partial [Planctomycetota bacterium]